MSAKNLKNVNNANELLSKAKAAVILDHPFFATLLLSMPFIQNDNIPTMATNGKQVIYNSAFVCSLTLNELIFVLAHETMHCVFQHMHRRGDKNPNKWNIACDYVINDILVKENVGDMPKMGLLDPQIVVKGGGTAEGVYGLLPKECEQKGAGKKGGAMDQIFEPSNGDGDADAEGDGAPGQGKPGKGQGDAEGEGGFTIDKDGHIKPGPVDDATMEKENADMRVRVAQAVNAAKLMGKLPGSLKGLVEELLKTETDWREVLRTFFNERTKTDLSYARPKRRFATTEYILPSLIGEKLGSIVIGIDCSGSVSSEEQKMFGAEIKAIVEDCAPSSVTVIYWDTRIIDTVTFGPDETFKLKDHGGGGTAVSPMFEAIERMDIPPVACVVLTDLAIPDFPNEPGYPVLWASTHGDSAPFGDVIKIKKA
jgi:predicted metal-dependent peptidase